LYIFRKIVEVPIDPKEKSSVIKEIAEWTENVNQQESEKTRKKEIFPTTNNNKLEIPDEKRKKLAENEKNKGNEALRSNVKRKNLNTSSEFFLNNFLGP
jgi:hypothetical protein